MGNCLNKFLVKISIDIGEWALLRQDPEYIAFELNKTKKEICATMTDKHNKMNKFQFECYKLSTARSISQCIHSFPTKTEKLIEFRDILMEKSKSDIDNSIMFGKFVEKTNSLTKNDLHTLVLLASVMERS